MKISNSKKQLAKIIHENGGWREGNCFAPKFEDLHDSAKAYWVADFEKYNNKAGVDSE